MSKPLERSLPNRSGVPAPRCFRLLRGDLFVAKLHTPFITGKRLTDTLKSGKTIQSHFFKNLKMYEQYSDKSHGQSFLIYGGDEEQNRSYGRVIPWKKTYKLFM
ncbi:MAG: hypothetical protein OXM55_02505 [Bdellovibrionales bacterium]|nr:hypothetical protein [Bdellovibrionales bacterium]